MSESAGAAPAAAVVSTTAAAQAPPPLFGKSDCPRHIVNLDLPPERRWDSIVPLYREHIPGVLGMIDDVVQSDFAIKLVESCLKTAVFFGSVKYSKELGRIAELVGVSIGKVILLQLAYEAFAACTSVVANGEPGHPLHIRTMDWEMPELAPLTIEVEFHRGGRPVATATTWAGYVGVLTGVRTGAFSASVNYRRSELMSEKPLAAFMKNLWGVVASKWPVSYVHARYALRELLTQSERATYASALDFLSEVHLVAPCYITLAGTRPGEGCVCSMERRGAKSVFLHMPNGTGIAPAPTQPPPKTKKSKAAATTTKKKKKKKQSSAAAAAASGGDDDDEAALPPPSVAQAEDNGFVVQTNMDAWRDDAVARTGSGEEHDWQDICDSRHRRLFARWALAQCQREHATATAAAAATTATAPATAAEAPVVSETDLWTIMSTPPTLAHDTVYTTFMEPATGRLVTRVQVRAEQTGPAKHRFRALRRKVLGQLAEQSGGGGGGGATRQ